MLFLIQSNSVNGIEIPSQDFGYAIIEAIEYKNWWNHNNEYRFLFPNQFILNNPAYKKYIFETGEDIIPVGSVEYCLEFYKDFGIKNIEPLNIPKELLKFTKRKCSYEHQNYIDELYLQDNKKCFIKSPKYIKSNMNDIYDLKSYFNFIDDKNYFYIDFTDDEKYFVSEYVDNVISEWRCFIYNKEILGIKNYSGDEWHMPNKKYVQEIVDNYDKKCYTLDVMVYESKKTPLQKFGDEFVCHTNYQTDIVELHDFFACGLYGFEHPKLLDMMICTHKEILKGNY